MIRQATLDDIGMVKHIANKYPRELGYVMMPSLRDAVGRNELLVYEVNGRIFGFVNYRTRRDGWHTVYEIAVDKPFRGGEIGRALIEAVPTPIRLKCTVDNKIANGFYEHLGFCLVRQECGRKRQLNVWELKVRGS